MTDKYRGHSRSPLDTHESKKLKRDQVFIRIQSIRCFLNELFFF
jgi:hypothetical protein